MKKSLLTLMTLFAFVAFGAISSVKAYNTNDHVYEAANGVGDALIFPVYFASGTFKTNLRVINTSPTHSIVAKVVFREALSSCETRDFLIFLSPNDVWEAEIVEKNGATTITSDDDSSPVVPLEVAMADSCNGYDDIMGYVEVYEAFAFDNFSTIGANVTDATVTPSAPISKDLIKAAYDAVTSDLSISAACDEPVQVVAWDEDGNGVDDHWARVWKSQPVMAGVQELKDPNAGLVLPKVATALANNCNHVKLNVSVETRWDNYGHNSEFEVRAALSKDKVHIPYRTDAENDTFVLFNFPVKLSCCTSGSDDCDGSISSCETTTSNTLKGDECLTYDSSISIDGDCLHRTEFATSWNFQSYDLEENTQTAPDEIFSPVPQNGQRPPIDVEVLLADVEDFQTWDLTYSYDEGWIRLALTDYSGHRAGLMRDKNTWVWYGGSAVIPSYFQIAEDISWVPATYDCSMVVVSDASIDDASGENPDPPYDTTGHAVEYNNCSFQVISPIMMP